MKKHITVVSCLLVLVVLIGGCVLYSRLSVPAVVESVPVVTESTKPVREPYPDCTWEKITGAGLELWGQHCGDIAVGVSETLPGVFQERQTATGKVAELLLLRVFDLPTGKIEEVLPTLAQDQSWSASEGCAFTKDYIKSNDKVSRYTLAPSGAGLTAYQALAANQPILSTCTGYGMGNSGVQYFEIHATSPNKALFINAGQEQPLFDEASIVIK